MRHRVSGVLASMTNSKSTGKPFTYLRLPDPGIADFVPGAEKRNWGLRFISGLLFFIPKTNGGRYTKYKDVHSWKVEYDQRNCATQREIGLDASNQPIVCAPRGEERGYWTQFQPYITIYYDSYEAKDIAQAEFEQDWKKLNP